MLVGIHDEAFVDINVHSMLGSSSCSFRRSVFEPCSSTQVISSSFEGFDFFVTPTRHGQGLASMTDGLVTGFTFIANKGQKLDTDGGKAKLFLVAAVGTTSVGLELGKLFDTIFG